MCWYDSPINEIINENFRLLFDMKKEEVNKIIKINETNDNDDSDEINKKNKTNKKILGFLNSFIGEYGVEIKSKIKNIYNKKT